MIFLISLILLQPSSIAEDFYSWQEERFSTNEYLAKAMPDKALEGSDDVFA
jgi:hypothetical protein